MQIKAYFSSLITLKKSKSKVYIMKIKTLRKHDSFYLNENRYKKTKEIFKFVGEKIIKFKEKKNTKISIADFGCANGEFQYYLYRVFKGDEIYGYDSLNELLLKAKKMVPEVKFKKGSILEKETCDKNSFHVTTAIGILSIFDSFEATIDNLIHWTKPGGKILLHALLNEDPIDINIKYSHSKNWKYQKPKFWESGWNVYSIATIKKYLIKKKVKNFIFDRFTLKSNLTKRDDTLRSWTVNLDGKKVLTNSLNFIQHHYIIEIDL